ncbi:MAG: tyrosine--tRNA ligase [Candidatus Dormibacteraeota bacterium]|uniref:Tyrosyl-tRNA synthetase n=1 Tax=Candidatus Amunia macphersoniae TaxID=3127014 RepID=A0A934KDC3_9BACT|nr:tyrosine--tRNA ligase [Candidatus Dormibacteraeota bacterium]
MSTLSTADRMALIERNTAEVMGRDDLLTLLGTSTPIRHYIGFEISGKVHLGSGLVAMGKVRDFLDAGVDCHILLADWHTWINDKLGGDRDLIRRIATGYFTEAMKASLLAVGADPVRVHFVLGTDLYANNLDYWSTVIEVSRNTTLSRMLRSISILGREQSDSVDFAKLVYPAMQAADIFAQGINLAHAGTEQRKAHVIARDVATKIRTNRLTDLDGHTVKPAAVHHPLLLGLRKPPVWPLPEDVDPAALKMSKSDPSSAVFVHDDPDTIRRRVAKAFCPPGETRFNPVLNWFQQLVFGLGGAPVRVDRSQASGGPVTFDTYEDLAGAYGRGDLHPGDAKNALTAWLIDYLEPARGHFATPRVAAMLEEIESALSTRR